MTTTEDEFIIDKKAEVVINCKRHPFQNFGRKFTTGFQLNFLHCVKIHHKLISSTTIMGGSSTNYQKLKLKYEDCINHTSKDLMLMSCPLMINVDSSQLTVGVNGLEAS